jgi:hypothetical protein
MSLVTTASAWISDDLTNKKRVPTIKRTNNIKSKPTSTQPEYSSVNETFQSSTPSTIEDAESANSNRNNRVNMLLDKITSAGGEEESNALGNFNPIAPPSINPKRDIGDNVDEQQYMPPIPRFKNAGTASNIYGQQQGTVNYGANDTKATVYSNYNKSYETPPQFTRTPYYANMGISNTSGDSKLLEKINYMIHLLEQQQSEKTDNITEEFILYSFLGIFIIFVVDSFARAGKYTR